MYFCDCKMVRKCLLKLFRCRRFCHFWQCLHELLLRGIKVREFVDLEFPYRVHLCVPLNNAEKKMVTRRIFVGNRLKIAKRCVNLLRQ